MMYLSANKDVGIPNNSIIAIKERTYYLLLHWQLLQFFKGRLGLLECIEVQISLDACMISLSLLSCLFISIIKNRIGCFKCI